MCLIFTLVISILHSLLPILTSTFPGAFLNKSVVVMSITIPVGGIVVVVVLVVVVVVGPGGGCEVVVVLVVVVVVVVTSDIDPS